MDIHKLIEKLERAATSSKSDCVVAQERMGIGTDAQYRAVEKVFYDKQSDVIVVVVGSERVSRAAVGQGWRPL